jgi:hypothetical protein
MEIRNPKESMFHHGLIRILIEHHLSWVGDTWDSFFKRNHFLDKPSPLPENPEHEYFEDSNLPRVHVEEIPHHVYVDQTLTITSNQKDEEFKLEIWLNPDFHPPDISLDHFDQNDLKKGTICSIVPRITRSMTKKGVTYLKSHDLESIISRLKRTSLIQSEQA